MNKTIKKESARHNSPMAVLPIIAGVALNYIGSLIAARLGLPLYLDNIGTISAAVLGGYLPGIVTAIINNLINYVFDPNSIYYASISALFAITAAYFFRRDRLKKVSGTLHFIITLAFIGGVLGGLITLILSGPSVNGIYTWLCNHGFADYYAHEISSFVYDLADKSITTVIALLIVHFIPDSIKPKLLFSGWKQTPNEFEEHKLNKDLKDIKIDGRSLNTRITLMLIFASLAMALVVTGVSSSLFRTYSRDQHLNTAAGVARLAAAAVDPEKVGQYLEEGDSAEGYKETENLLYSIRESSPDIEYVYVYKIEEDGCHVVFDLDTDELKGEEPGTLVPFDESFSEYVPDLLAGKPIDPIETDDTYGWLLTAYEPVYNAKGECVCYAAADVLFSDIKAYEKDFATKVVLLFLGFFILILVIGLWLAKYHVILPINSMASCANDFAFSEGADDQALSEENLRKILDLRIETGDEVQNLYESFCKMTADAVSHMKSIREQGESINELQRGLIITLADMVEGRDSDTGNHIRKTAAYTRIIMDGLKRKGYYEDQLTDKFVYDVEHSAPLHDIGKISVSDVILNKPGRLTDEEFAIMQTHTTAGKKILDQVIETVHGESYLKEARNLAAYHHEKWNGKGYPEGLAGEDIPLSARIMAIADVFDALSSKRVYKDAMPFDKAVSIIREDAGTHFDPKCAEAFLDSLDEVKAVLDYYNKLEAEGESVRGNELQSGGDKQ